MALVHPYPWSEVRRGGERYLADLAWYLTGAGHEVRVLTSGAPRGHRVEDGIDVQVLPRVARPWLHAVGLTPVELHGLVAVPTLLRQRFDLVHALTPSGALAGRLSGHRTVYTELGHPTAEDFADRPGARRLWRAAVVRASAVTALSASAAAAVSGLSGRVPEVLAPGCRLDVFHPPADAGRAPGPPVVLFPADASQPRKGLDLLLAAVPRLLAVHPDLELHLGGPGDPEWALGQVSDPAVRAAVRVLGVGPRDAVPDRYRAATVTVLPAWNEAFGLVLVESLACGTPAVCTAADGMREIVDAAVGGSFDRGDVGGLADALLAAIALARRQSTSARCVERARRFGWAESVGPRHEALYERVLAGKATAVRPHRIARGSAAPEGRP